MVKKLLKYFLPERLLPGTVARELVESLQNKRQVDGGIFSGMQYVNESVCSSNTPKLLGCYEAELHPVFKHLLNTPFEIVIDVGAAEGYYAVGCALRWPRAKIVAFETTETGRNLLYEVACANQVESRIEIRGHCELSDLKVVAERHINGLLIMDIEGGESSILDIEQIPELIKFHIIVEIHDFIDPTIGDLIRKRFSNTHSIEEIWTRPRSVADFDTPSSRVMRFYTLRNLRLYANEYRPGPMRWFYLTPKPRS